MISSLKQVNLNETLYNINRKGSHLCRGEMRSISNMIFDNIEYSVSIFRLLLHFDNNNPIGEKKKTSRSLCYITLSKYELNCT